MLVRPIGVLWPLQLDLQTLHADLKPVHGLDGGLGRSWVVEGHETWKYKPKTPLNISRYRKKLEFDGKSYGQFRHIILLAILTPFNTISNGVASE